MIYTERKITISNSGASIDSPIILYRGDKEIEILFTIVDSKFKFSSEKGNYIINTGAKFAQLAVDLPDGTDLFTDISECLDGAVLFKITGDMIDEIREIGFYSFHIRLFDESKKSRITIPPVLKGIEIKSPMVTESTVGYATADNSRVDDNEESFIDEDGKLTIEWKKGDVISSVKLNQMVEVVNNAVDEEKQRQQNELIRQNNEEIRQDAIEYAVETYDMTINELNSEKNKIKPYVDDILESAISEHVIAFTEVEGSVISERSFDGYLKDLEILGNTIQDADNLADIRSVGDKVENQELYEIPVLSTGKNLLDLRDRTIKSTQVGNKLTYDISCGTFTMEYTTSYPCINIDISDMIPFLSGKFYKVSAVHENSNPKLKTVQYLYGVYPSGENYYSSNSPISPVPSELKSLSVRIVSNNSSTVVSGVDKISNIQLEEGLEATEYEPYIEDKLTILSPVQLEKVGDVTDRIICKDGVWGVEKNVGTTVFDGSEHWRYHSTIDNTSFFQLSISSSIYRLPKNDNTKANILSNRFLNTVPNIGYNNDIEGIYLDTRTNLSVRILNTKLNTQDLAGFKSWLSENSILLKYQLTQPTFIPLPHDQQIKLRTFANKTNIHFECEIEPTLKASVPKSLGATVNTHIEQIDNLGKELDRVKKLEESTTLTITTESDFTTVEATSNGYFEDVKLEGRTLVNLAGERNDINNGLFSQDLYYIPDCDKLTVFISTTLDTTHMKGAFYKKGGSSIIAYNEKYINNPFLVKFDKNITKEHEYVVYVSKYDGTSYVDMDKSKVKILVLEGDHTQNPPEYFEGLKSVGDGVDEISVLSSTFEEYKLEQGSINPQGNIVSAKQDKKRILYYNTETDTWEKPVLRQWDSIEKHSNGKYYYHKRSGEVVLNGNENWALNSEWQTDTLAPFYCPDFVDRKPNGELVFDRFSFHKNVVTSGYECAGRSDGTVAIYVNVLKSRLSTQDVAGFKAWLQANPATLVYQLEEEKVYECTNLDLITYENETNLIVNTGAIAPLTTLKVMRNINNVVRELQQKVSNLENYIQHVMIDALNNALNE